MCCQSIWMKRLPACTLAKIGVTLDELTDEQSGYLGISKNGPFKSEHYRY